VTERYISVCKTKPCVAKLLYNGERFALVSSATVTTVFRKQKPWGRRRFHEGGTRGLQPPVLFRRDVLRTYTMLIAICYNARFPEEVLSLNQYLHPLLQRVAIPPLTDQNISIKLALKSDIHLL
jgi:hypothetical protein